MFTGQGGHGGPGGGRVGWHSRGSGVASSRGWSPCCSAAVDGRWALGTGPGARTGAGGSSSQCVTSNEGWIMCNACVETAWAEHCVPWSKWCGGQECQAANILAASMHRLSPNDLADCRSAFCLRCLASTFAQGARGAVCWQSMWPRISTRLFVK